MHLATSFYKFYTVSFLDVISDLTEVKGTLNVLSGLKWKDDLLDTSSYYFKTTSFKVANKVDLCIFSVFMNKLTNYYTHYYKALQLLLRNYVHFCHFSHAKIGTYILSYLGGEQVPGAYRVAAFALTCPRYVHEAIKGYDRLCVTIRIRNIYPILKVHDQLTILH